MGYINSVAEQTNSRRFGVFAFQDSGTPIHFAARFTVDDQILKVARLLSVHKTLTAATMEANKRNLHHVDGVALTRFVTERLD